MVIGQTAEHIDQLREVVEQGVTRSAETEARIVELAQILAAQKPVAGRQRASGAHRRRAGADGAALARSAQGATARPRRTGARPGAARAHRAGAGADDRRAGARASAKGGGGGIDAETRARLRSIDTQVLRILEDLSAGRQDLVTEIRQDIARLAEALRAVAARGRY